ncbi:MAG: response regulator [Anaerolineae bacterium]|nr:response regulator [Anaerolineae bacterium]
MPLALIVEDTTDIAGLIEINLSQIGLECHHAVNGRLALEFLSGKHPDVMLLDIGMPGMSGWEVLEQIKDRWPQANFPVIVLTAFDDPANKLIGKLQDRVYRYMTKPFNPEDVVQAVRDALGMAS